MEKCLSHKQLFENFLLRLYSDWTQVEERSRKGHFSINIRKSISNCLVNWQLILLDFSQLGNNVGRWKAKLSMQASIMLWGSIFVILPQSKEATIWKAWGSIAGCVSKFGRDFCYITTWHMTLAWLSLIQETHRFCWSVQRQNDSKCSRHTLEVDQGNPIRY